MVTRFVRWRLLAAALLAAAACSAQPQPSPPAAVLSLLESAPVETTLDHADLPPTDEVWRAMIGGARTELALAHFYASNRAGSRLEPVVQALLAAAERGVRVRLLADAGMARTYPETLDRLAAHPGIEVRRYDLKARTGGVHHAKYLVADGADVCVGSANFDWRSLEHIQELGVRVRSVALARDFLAVFDLDWQLAGGDSSAPAPAAAAAAATGSVTATWADSPVRVTPLFSPQGLLPEPSTWELPRLVEAIGGARERVLVQLLSYRPSSSGGAPFTALDAALRAAAARGVDVRLLVADWSRREGAIAPLQALRAAGVRVRFVSIPQAREGPIPYARVAHAKLMVVDREVAWIGSSNWSGDYFTASRNAGLLLEGEAFAGRVARFILATWDSGYASDVGAAPRAAALDRDGRWLAPSELLEVVRVVDGDTIHVRRAGQILKLRLLSVDTEEKGAVATSPASTKPATRFGNETAQWAQRFFAANATVEGAVRVGLILPDGKEVLDRYGRLLCHVVLPNGSDYNLLLVREGKSPYFNKYGNSTVCHESFLAAQASARAAQRGIWDPATNAPRQGLAAPRRPYAQLLPWWDARAAAVEAFRAAHAADPERCVAVEDEAGLRAALERAHEVELFGTIDSIETTADDGWRVAFSVPDGAPRIAAVVPRAARARIAALGLEAAATEMHQNYVWLRGRLSLRGNDFEVAAGDPAQWRIAAPAFAAGR